MSHTISNYTPPTYKVTVSAAITIVFLLTFFFVMLFVYLPFRPEPVGSVIAKNRLDRLQALQEKEEQLSTTYFWIDQSAGAVHIPISQAILLSIEAINTPVIIPSPCIEAKATTK